MSLIDVMYKLIVTYTMASPSVDGMCLQYDNLDTEHKGLFKSIAACAENRSDKACLDTPLRNVVEHFADEEVSQYTPVSIQFNFVNKI